MTMMRWLCVAVGVASFYSFEAEAQRLKDLGDYEESGLYSSERVGGALVISPRRDEIPSRLRRFCERIPVPSREGSRSWHDAYSEVEFNLASAFDIAETRMGGGRRSITGARDVHIVIIPGSPPTAAVNWTQDAVTVYFNDSMIRVVEAVASSLTLELDASAFREISGVSYSDWLELLRTPDSMIEAAQMFPGPDPRRDSEFWRNWFAHTRIMASMLYEFVIGHELAHVVRDVSSDRYREDPVSEEWACDALAIRSFQAGGFDDHDEAIVSAIALMTALWYQTHIAADESALSLIDPRIRPIVIQDTLDWRTRAINLREIWRGMRPVNKRRDRSAVYQFLGELALSRPPMRADAIDAASDAKLSFPDANERIRWNTESNSVDFVVPIKNESNDRIITCTLEVQSRYAPRDQDIEWSTRVPRDSRDRRYFVRDIHTEKVEIEPGRTAYVSGTLAWHGDSASYPYLNYRTIAVAGRAPPPRLEGRPSEKDVSDPMAGKWANPENGKLLYTIRRSSDGWDVEAPKNDVWRISARIQRFGTNYIEFDEVWEIRHGEHPFSGNITRVRLELPRGRTDRLQVIRKIDGKSHESYLVRK